MADVISTIFEGLKQSFLMAYEVWWALVFGFAISGIVQAWVPKERIEATMAGGGAKPVAWATGLGAASSSCSYAAIAIAKRLFQKGASAASVLAFQFASTNLVWELGLVLWVLLGWQFTLAEYLGGILMIVLMALLLRFFVSPRVEEQARAHAQEADASHEHEHGADEGVANWRERLTSIAGWSEVATNFRGDWLMLWKEISVGFLLAGFIGLLGNDFFNVLFITDAPGWVVAIENVIVGPLIAVLSFVCSVGNIPLAAVLWSGGISFAGVMAFIFADLIVLPIVRDLPQVLRLGIHCADRRPDAADDDRRRPGDRRPLQRCRADPDDAAESQRHLQLGRARLQVGAQPAWPDRLRGAVLAQQAGRGDRQRLPRARLTALARGIGSGRVPSEELTEEPNSGASPVRYAGATKRYPGSAKAAVDDLTLEVPAGEICVLVGPSGCGKTTAMRMVNRTVEMTAGDILIGERSVRDREPAQLRREIGYVIQQIGLFPHRTIAENIAAVPQLLGWKKEQTRARTAELLELIGLDPELGERYPAQLSGGQQQRVGVARALAADPLVMLMDEPFGAIDPISRERLQNEFLRLQAELRKTVLFVTHDIDEAIKMGDRIAIMREGGKVAQYATPGRGADGSRRSSSSRTSSAPTGR